MGVSDLQVDTKAGPVLDLSAQGMQKLDPSFICSEDTHTLILDRNHIMKLDNLERSLGLQQLSVASNRLVRMMGVSRLTELRVLNLPNNSIGYIEGLRDLPHLKWLNLSGNNIKHVQLVQYLAIVCPLTSSPALETAEDAKLEKILSKQRFHQRQLLEETQGGCPRPPRPTQLDVEMHSPSHVPQGGAREVKKNSAPTPASTPATAPLVQETDSVVQFNTWVSCDTSHPSVPIVRSPNIRDEHIFLEDVQTDEDKLSCCLLSSESTFLPFTSDLEPQTTQSDTEVKEARKQEEVGMCINKSSVIEANRAAVKIQSWWRGQVTRCFHPMAKEVRSEIRLRRMQEHILFLSDKLDRVEKQYEEEKIQRLVQEEAVKFLWKELQSMQQWKQSVEQQLSNITETVIPAQTSHPALCKASPAVASSTTNPPSTDLSFPDSGFQSTADQQAVQEDSLLSSGTADSLKTVRALSPVYGGLAGDGHGVESADCSLLEQYLCSVQQREEEAEEVISDRIETPQPASPISPSKTVQSSSTPHMAVDSQSSEVQRMEGTNLCPV
ncbi:Centrosomal protein of 97 kDa [Channa argus]|uniref:Centrosomal protein of 97 kDa n=1 Tax=Channa argus TaxID=215402 RepID=A0A6G1PX58_CHAAH|nr:Centrosomal protein of 97 kDa [Channa argus]